jgi:hypothetical protein
VTARLLLANALELCVGLGIASVLRAPLGTSYLLGLGAVGIVSAHLALVHVSFGWVGLVAAAVGSLAVASLVGGQRPATVTTRQLLPSRKSYRLATVIPRQLLSSGNSYRKVSIWGAAGLAALAALLARAWPTFAAKPLDDYDGWAMWGMKAKALTLFGWADPDLFAAKAAAPLHLDYPLLVPSLDAVAARAMGGFDPRLIHLQFLLFGVAGAAALHALLRDRTPPWLRWPALVAVLASPGLTGQLLTGYADIPLALFVAAALVAAVRWIDDGEPRTLALATAFLAAAAMTKNEGAIFVGAALVALAVTTRRIRAVLLAAGAIEAVLLPWQVWTRLNGVHSDTLVGGNAVSVHHPGIFPEALRILLEYALSLHAWPFLLPLFVAAVVAAAGTRVALFAWAWALVSVFGLTWIYVVSPLEYSNYLAFSGERVIDSLLVGAAALTPLLAAQATSRIGRS